MSRVKTGKWMKDNAVLLIGIPLIIGVHWGWYKLQEVPYLVDQSERKREFPIFSALKAISNKVLERMENRTGTDEPSTTTGKN